MRRNAAVDMLIGQRTGNFEAAVACKYSTCDRVQREGGAQSARRDVFPEQRLTQGRAIKLQSVFRGHRMRRRVEEFKGMRAAVVLQTAYRGHVARHTGRDQAQIFRLVRRLQATFRGHRIRQRVLRERGEAWLNIMAMHDLRLNPRRGVRSLEEALGRAANVRELPGGVLLLALLFTVLVPSVDACATGRPTAKKPPGRGGLS